MAWHKSRESPRTSCWPPSPLWSAARPRRDPLTDDLATSADRARLGLKILYVEDDEGIREAIAALLEDEGYEVAAVDSAEAGLELLEAVQFYLVITDFSLPGRNGQWLIEQARARQLLRGAPTMMMSAHPLASAPETELFRKPVDLDQFLARVHAALAANREAWVHRSARNVLRAEAAVQLALYVTGSAASMRAIRNLEELLEGSDSPLSVSVVIYDLTKDVEAHSQAERDHVAFAPTLVRRHPLPKARIVGDLSDAGPVLALLPPRPRSRSRIQPED